jgi:hypothetical protein
LYLVDDFEAQFESMLAQMDSLGADRGVDQVQFLDLLNNENSSCDWYELIVEAIRRLAGGDYSTDPWESHELHLLPERRATRTRLDMRTMQWKTDSVIVKLDEGAPFEEGDSPFIHPNGLWLLSRTDDTNLQAACDAATD